MLKDILPFLELNGQFDKLTDRTEGTQVPELAEGALPKQYIYTVAHASGSERYVFFPLLIFCFCLFLFPCNSVLIRGKCFCFLSVKFRVNPWLMLLLGLLSVARLRLYYTTPNPLFNTLKPTRRNFSILIYLKTMVLIKLCIPNN